MTLEQFKQLNLPEIDPVAEGIDRPFWSVMIPTHNRTKYLEEALRSVLAQDPGTEQMQIVVVDDFSTQDDPEPLVREIGQGRISFYRQPHNVGQFTNLNTCIERARGHWVHILHDDDLVRPGFYSNLRASLENNSTIGAAFCRFSLIDGESRETFVWPPERNTPGILENWLQRIAVEPQIQTPSIVVRRKVYEEVGGFNPEILWVADWEMWQRIATYYPFWYEPEPLACYRIHSNAISAEIKRTGNNIVDVRKAIAFAQSYLPQPIAKEIEINAKEYWALFALRTARTMLAAGDIEAAAAQIQESLKCSTSASVIGFLVSLRAGIPSYDFTGIAQWAQIAGNSSIEKILLLQQVVKQLPAGAKLAELGCFQGRNSVAIAAVLPPNSVLYCIDDFQASKAAKKFNLEGSNLLDVFTKNLERFGVRNKILILNMGAIQAAEKFESESLDLIFIEGERDYDSVKSDLLNWYPKLKPNGFLFCEGYAAEWPGVMRAIKIVGLEGRAMTGSLWMHRKPV